MYILVFTVRASGCLAIVLWFVCRQKCERSQNSKSEQFNIWTFHLRNVASKWVSSRKFGLFIYLTFYKHAPEITANVTGVGPSTSKSGTHLHSSTGD